VEAAGRRARLHDALWTDKPLLAINALELIEEWSVKPGRKLVDRKLLLQQIGDATQTWHGEKGDIEETASRFRRTIATRLTRMVLKWNAPERTDQERLLAKTVEERIAEIRKRVAKDTASEAEEKFLAMLDAD